MQNIKKILFLLPALLITALLKAQDGTAVADNTGDVMRSGGKIYVVMVIVITILAGLLFYVVRLDAKISRLEKTENSEN